MEYHIEKDKRASETIFHFPKKKQPKGEDETFEEEMEDMEETQKRKLSQTTHLVDGTIEYFHTPPKKTDTTAVKCMHCEHGTATYHEEKFNVKTAERKVKQCVISLSPMSFGFDRCRCSRCLFKCDIDDTYHTPGSTCEHAEAKEDRT